ncbi:MAG TPA: outer membrane protein assembly factor BamE [Rhodocyclaceae bacterium]|nr:outer membrane protein assembly factor BamE [Rhodocyclaceae bacterium]
MKRFILVALPLVAACSSAPDITSRLTPYRIDVRQGNFVTQEMVAQLKPGQTKDQVRFILGTPLLADIFHADRWDYVYRFQPGHGQVQQRHVTVYFKDGKLVRVAGDVVPGVQGSAPTAPQIVDIGQPPAGKETKPEEAKPQDAK